MRRIVKLTSRQAAAYIAGILGGLAAIAIAQPAVLEYLASHGQEIKYFELSVSTMIHGGNTRFIDVARESGLTYRWAVSGPRPRDILQTIGNGCAFIDADNDGRLDILLIGPTIALYKGDGHGRFSDVTHEFGIDSIHGHFLGCAIGDYDNDGFEDIYLSGYRTSLLLHNQNGHSFSDVTNASGISVQPWATSCAWGDVDGDGLLDIYICNYVKFDPMIGPRLCGGMQGCGPTYYAPEHGVLYHNDGHGKFHDITKISGASKVSGNALGVCFADYDGSGRQSIAIANDMRPGDLLKNGISGLRNVSVESGIITDTVHPVAGMGIDWGDYDNDGQPDLFLTAFSGQNKPVLHNCGNGTFENQSDKLGLDKPANQALTFGAKWIDYDNDGWLDLILANGGVYENAGTAQYLEPSSLFHNNHGRHLEDMSLLAGPDLTKLILGRGLAIGDYDNDGLVDVLVANSEGLPVLLHNASANTGHWLSITLVGTKSNRDGIGATVTVTAGKLTQVRLCHTDGSYLSSSDKRVHVGMGNHLVADSLMIHWPSGEIQSLRDVRCDRQITLTEGK